MRLARAAAAAVAALLLVGCGAADTVDIDPPTTAGDGAVTTSPAGADVAGSDTAAPSAEPGSCGWRHVNPEEPISGDLFADCVVDATILAGTAMMDSTTSTGISSSGPVTFRDPISVHLTGEPSGIEIIVVGEQGWLFNPEGGGWVASDPNGDPRQQMAHSTVMTYAATADPDVIRALLATAEEWTPTGADTIGGSIVQGYSGTPVQEGVTYDNFIVWITEDDLPMRYDQGGTGYGGYAFTSQLDFTAYGEPVEIGPPADAA